MANERDSRVAVVHECFPEGGDKRLLLCQRSCKTTNEFVVSSPDPTLSRGKGSGEAARARREEGLYSIVAKCPGMTGTVPEFLHLSRSSHKTPIMSRISRRL